MGADVSRACHFTVLALGLLFGCEIATAREPAATPAADPRGGSPAPRREAASTPKRPPGARSPGIIDADVLAASASPRPADPRTGDPDGREAGGGAPLRRAEPVESVVREVFFGDRDASAVALSFDDGPSRENTPRILEVLAREGAPATFFVLGARAEKMPDLVADIDAAGHEVGNHTWSHGSLRSMWASQITDELTRTGDAVFAAIGRRPALFRPPFGRYAPSALPLIGQLGMNVVLWSVDAEDWDRGSDEIARTVVADARPGDIVLLHDRTAATAHALPAIIRGLRARGFTLVTVSELTGLPPYASPRASD